MRSSSGQCSVTSKNNCFELTGYWELFLGFDSHMADAADDVVGGGLAIFHGYDFDGIGLVVRAQDQVITGGFDILHGAIFVFEDGVHVELALTVGLE